MDKIVVTEKQDELIKWALECFEQPKNRLWNLMDTNIGLDMVTIARILVGEEYEVKREFKVGDIVLNNTYPDNPGPIFIVNERHLENKGPHWKLLCKAENRDDLQ